MNFNQGYYMDDYFDKGCNNYDRHDKKYICVKAIYFFPVCSYYNDDKHDDCKYNQNNCHNRKDDCFNKRPFFNCCRNNY